MKAGGVKSRGRGRKRRRGEGENGEGDNEGDVQERVKNGLAENGKNAGSSRKRGRPPKRRAIEGVAVVGRYVLKDFEGNGVFLGKVVSYDSGLYRVDYEDGDCEDLDSEELREVLLGDERAKFVGVLLERKNKLDENVASKSEKPELNGKVKSEGKRRNARKAVVEKGNVGKVVGEFQEVIVEKGNVGKVVEEFQEVKVETVDNVDEKVSGNLVDDTVMFEVAMSSERVDEENEGSEVDDDVSDSSSDSCEYGQGWDSRSEIELSAIPPPELPPSSGNIGVPEECVSYLFSVYGFLRSFSFHLFLSPFSLDDLVGCLNCTVPNTLLDAIHVALLRALRRHLEAQAHASDGPDLASKCLRCIDWSLLDNLTWPMYLVHYLMVMGHLNWKEWKGFYIDVLQKDYCTLSIGTKLMVLQILCDDALDAAEIRAEIDDREESEVGVDYDGIMPNSLEGVGPRKVYPRSAKTSIVKDRENVIPVSENNISFGSDSLTAKGEDQDLKSDFIEDDENSDECRLCGMEGMLLCCDGCPRAYHSRCIGVNKLSIPMGKWFCPECKISRIGPAVTMKTSLRGAEVFGVDPYAQLFMGTCNHLLVLKVSIKASPFVRYYNCNDIPKVLTALCSSEHHVVSYTGICQAILNYWELPQVWLPPVATLASSQSALVLEKKHDDFQLSSAENGNQVPNKVELETYANGIGENALNNVPGSGYEKCFLTPGSNDVSLGALMQSDIAVPRMNGTSVNECSPIMSCKLSEHAELFCSSQQGMADISSMTGVSSCTTGYKNSSAGQKNGVCLPGKEISGEARCRAAQQRKDNCLYVGSFFKPYAYINHYVHGDFAASAAANFSLLSADEIRSSEIHASDPRKAMAANVALQAKAFSSAAVRFFWPSTEKKLIEIPRERCSWCLHCKAPVTSRKACLLNQAALNATRSAMKFCSGLKLVKNVEGGLYGIAAYALYLEESLRGLIVGPFQSESYQKQWRKKVEQATTCSEMKSLFLKLEKNLCTNALSSEWTKLVDSWMDESSVPQSACTVGSNQKRGPGRRKKHLATSEIIADDSKDSLSDLNWRSGKLSKLVFQRGTLPCSVLRKAARQGGSRRIPGIYYAEGSDLPKRSRQFIWRAAVQMSMNASGLALQVRFLDHHIKWGDLLRPEQNLQDGKGPETEAFAFRNARICGKKVVENKIMYGISFGHQKNLSTRLMKSIIEKEETEDGKEKYWFLETRIPLYLIKEYEENAEKTYLPSSKKPDLYTKHQKRQLKASRKNAIFLYLTRKIDKLQMCLCAACHQDVLLGVSVMCSACEGFCHKGCVLSSTVVANDDVEFTTTCKQCSRGKGLTLNNSTVESPTSPLVVQGQEYQKSATVAKSVKLKATSQQHQKSSIVPKSIKVKINGKALPSFGTLESQSEKNPASSDSSLSKTKKRILHWGLIWKKKPVDGDGSDFRSKNILFRETTHGVNSSSPECQLCQKPYSPHLMYIRCESCLYWHHADAVELDESKLPNLVGYKCCRCRRIKTPVCPYADKKPEVKKLRIKGPKEETVPADSVSEAISEQAESLPSTPMSLMENDVYIQVDDPLLLSVSKVEPEAEVHFEWNTTFGPGPQKLPIRRHIKNERDDDGFIWGDYSAAQLPSSDETKNAANSYSEWDVPNVGLEDGTSFDFEDGTAFEYDNFNYENTDYEPQTYFSFTELLEADDGNQCGGVDVCGDAWEDLPCEYSQSGFSGHCDIVSMIDQVPATSMEAAIDATCNICLQTAPVPDLACHICGLQIHSQCSSGEEVSQGSWRCAKCQGWCG